LLNQIVEQLKRIPVRAWRLPLVGDGLAPTIQMLRGVYGAALHDLSAEAYRTVFADGNGGPALYMLRPSLGEDPVSTVEFLIFGPALDHEQTLFRAWDRAGGMGLGKARKKFVLGEMEELRPPNASCAWTLADTVCPDASCRLSFPFPLRLLRQGKLIEEPSFAEICLAILRRLCALAGQSRPGRDLQHAVLGEARHVPTSEWFGTQATVHRYSARQQRDIYIQGVCGHLDLPAGFGPLQPLLAAAQWTHLGKAYTLGLGRPVIEPL